MIDEETFNQIVELDEDETHDFSHGMVKAYFTQAHNTFDKMDVQKNLGSGQPKRIQAGSLVCTVHTWTCPLAWTAEIML